jgi:hypothetical protein
LSSGGREVASIRISDLDASGDKIGLPSTERQQFLFNGEAPQPRSLRWTPNDFRRRVFLNSTYHLVFRFVSNNAPFTDARITCADDIRESVVLTYLKIPFSPRHHPSVLRLSLRIRSRAPRRPLPIWFKHNLFNPSDRIGNEVRCLGARKPPSTRPGAEPEPPRRGSPPIAQRFSAGKTGGRGNKSG